MGLDIYHRLATHDTSKPYQAHNDIFEDKEARKSYSVEREIEFNDFKLIFERVGRKVEDYNLASRMESSGGFFEIKWHTEFKFVSNNGNESVLVTNRKPFWFFERRKYIHTGPLPTYTEMCNVIHYEEVGYQRNGFKKEFYGIFPPAFVLTSKNSVEKIFEFVVDEAKEHYKSNFIDNWDDERSMVFFWW